MFSSSHKKKQLQLQSKINSFRRRRRHYTYEASVFMKERRIKVARRL